MILTGAPCLAALFGVPAVLLALVTAYISVRIVIVSPRWPAVDGLVISSELLRDCKHVGLLGKGYHITYEYEIAGEQYSSGCVNGLPFPHLTENVARRIVERYPVGKQVKVYYKPENPEDAMLEPGWSWGYVYPIVRALIACGSLAIAVRVYMGWLGS